MIPSIREHFKNLVFIDWFRRFQGTKILKPESNETKSQSSELTPRKDLEKDSGFNEK